MAVIHFVDEKKDVAVDEDSPIKETCRENGIVFGCEEGICGTCLCTISEGCENLQPPNDVEIEFFGEAQLEQRLTCQARIRSGRVSLYQ